MNLEAQMRVQNAIINAKKGRKPDYPNSEPGYVTRIQTETKTVTREDGSVKIRTISKDCIKKSPKIQLKMGKKRPNKQAKTKIRSLINCSPTITRTNSSGHRVTKKVRSTMAKVFNEKAVELIKEGQGSMMFKDGKLMPGFTKNIIRTPLG